MLEAVIVSLIGLGMIICSCLVILSITVWNKAIS